MIYNVILICFYFFKKSIELTNGLVTLKPIEIILRYVLFFKTSIVHNYRF